MPEEKPSHTLPRGGIDPLLLNTLNDMLVATSDQAVARPANLDKELDSPVGKASLAVLPFANMSRGQEQDYFADGIAEDILTELSRFRNLFVIAHNSSFSFKGKHLSLPDIAKELNVEYIVSGSVRRAGTRVRVAAQLVQVSTGQEIWAEHYDRELADVFTVQDEVVRTIVETLEARLETNMARIASRRNTASMAAYDCVLLARRYLNLHDPSKALPYAERALELDPDYPHVHAVLGNAYYVKYFEDSVPELLEKSLIAARKAVALDEGDSRGHAILGMILTTKQNYELAGTHLKRAISLNPADTSALTSHAYWLLVTGHAEEALTALDEMHKRDPIPPLWHWDIRSTVFMTLRRFDEAILATAHLVNLFWYNHVDLAVCHAYLGQQARAKEEVEKVLQIRPNMTIRQFMQLDNFQSQEHRNLMAEGLRLAGLPE